MGAFDKFKVGNKVAKVESLGITVTYRELTISEVDAFNSRIIDGVDGDGKARIDYEEAGRIRYEKIALCLISPRTTVEELLGLSASAIGAINELAVLIDGGLGL